MDGVENIVSNIKQSIKNFAQAFNLPEDHIEDVVKALMGGVPLYTLVGMEKSHVEARYVLARQFFESRRYTDAEPLFRWLCMYASDASRNWLGLAATLQAEKKYPEAREIYQIVALMSGLSDPAPFYYSGICFIGEQNKEDAIVAFKTVCTLANPDDPEHVFYIKNAKNLLENLENNTSN